MRVNIKGLINRLDSLSERLDDLFDKLEKLDDLEQEEMAIEDVEQYFQNDDTFNLSVAIAVLEQADKLDRAFEIIKEKDVDVALFKECPNYDEYMEWCSEKAKLTLQEYDLLKEVLL